MRKIFTLSCVALFVAASMKAQSPTPAPKKWDSGVERLLRQQASSAQAPGYGKTAADTTLHVVIRTSDGAALASELRAKGYEATVINEGVVTAYLPLSAIPAVAETKHIRFISTSRRYRRFLHKARPAVGADKVHAEKTSLNTPYKGKGVIVAVIDQGFQYNHIAFRDANDQSRIIAMWDRNKKKKPNFGTITERYDGFRDAYGHATHVAGIAAGSEKGNDYYGMAPEADIIMIPSDFEDAELLEDVHFIDSVAAAKGKPWVTNMSFGGTVGPHDGKTVYDQTMASFLTKGPGRVITAAMGNDADSKLHASYKFKTDGEKVYLLFEPAPSETGQPSTEPNLYFQIWGSKTDSVAHLQITPYVHDEDNPSDTQLLSSHAKFSDFWASDIHAINKRENYEFYGNCDEYFKNMSAPILVMEISGNKDDEFHAWVSEGMGKIIPYTDTYEGIRPDNDYCVGEGAASIPGALAVGSITTATQWLDRGKNPHTTDGETVGKVSTFSSHGPWLGGEQKPTVLAPGCSVTSAFNAYATDMKVSNSDVVAGDGKKKNNYYGVMDGTSMASPAMAGIVALWLQANPQLTAAEIVEIARTTANPVAEMGGAAWTKEHGYGVVDAYKGLKAALDKVTSIHAVQRSEAPVSILREGGVARLLFGSAERGVQVQVFTLGGRLVESRSLGNVVPGQEEIVSLEAQPAGVYLLRITTPRATTTEKIIR